MAEPVWLTNVQKADTSKVIGDLCRGHSYRHLTTGEPKASETFTVVQLKWMGLVGIYEVAEESYSR